MIDIPAGVTKPSAAQAFEIVRGLCEAGGDTAEALAPLLLYFAKRPRRKVKTTMEWLNMACAVDGPITWKHYIWVRDGRGLATDGHRAHFARVSNVEDGAYIRCMRAHYSEFPTRAFEHAGHHLAALDTAVEVKLALSGLDQLSNLGDAFYKIHAGPVLNQRYLNEALNGESVAPLRWSDMNKVAGRSEFGDFVVMGVRL